MFTNHTYALSDDIQIFFTDGGPPPDSNDYTTLVVFHGSAFNGYGLEILHSHAHEFNLRTIIWNRRDYPGSTPYTDTELEDLKQSPKTFINKIGKHIGEFLTRFIERENIPQASEDGKAGGIAIMGWSMGTATAISLFSDATLLSPQAYSVLEKYVKDLVLNDSPHLCFGFSLPPEIQFYDTWTDPDAKTPREKYQLFRTWVSSFFNHPDPESGDLRGIDFMAKGSSSDATVTKWSTEQLDRYFSENAAVRSEFPMYVEPMQTVLRQMTEHILYNTNSHTSYFPRLKITMVYGTRTSWHSLWGAQELERTYIERVAGGVKARSLKFYKMIGANHFVHWEDPKLLLQSTADGIRR